MSTFTLDDIRAAADRKYGSTDIEIGDETVHLLNPLRLSAEAREEFGRLQEKLRDKDADTEEGVDSKSAEEKIAEQVAVLEDLLRCVAATKAQGQLLIEAVGGDLAVLAQVFETYGEKEQAGEASPSLD